MELVLGNVFIRPNLLPRAGDYVDGHKHNFDHVTYVCRGEIKVDKISDSGNIEKSRIIKSTDEEPFVLIKAGVNHRLEAMVDDSIFHCIYSHRNAQGEVIKEFDGFYEATE